MFFKSLQWRLIVIFITVTFSLMVFVSIMLNRSVESSYYDLFRSDLEQAFDRVSLYPDNNLSPDEIQKKLEDPTFSPMKGEFRSYTIINKDTSLIVESTDKNYIKDKIKFNEDIMKSENLISAFAALIGKKEKLTRNGEEAFFDYAYPVGNYVLYFKLDSGEWRNTINKFNSSIYFSGSISIIISLLLGFI